jgi:EAL domain-containing protein (putative c-di-GMP-specific phosphodiesterase class I)
VLLADCTLDTAQRIAENLRQAIREFRFVWGERVMNVGVSIGLAEINGASESLAAILSAADVACYSAKDSGRNRVQTYRQGRTPERHREMQWVSRINRACEENRLELLCQPIVPIRAGVEKLRHFELLLRMRDEKGAIVSPGEFIQAAERYGITPRIDRWVITNALRWLVSEADERERLAMCSINLSGQSMTDEKFLPFVQHQLKSSGIDGSKICFEITEHAAINSHAQANRFMQALKREYGCKFALDDFGIGVSSFGYLKHFPVDFLKIDGSFVKSILTDPIDREMVRSINEIGHLTHKQTIAEFAENEEIINMLRSLGVDYAQGYGVSSPQRILKIAANG